MKNRYVAFLLTAVLTLLISVSCKSLLSKNCPEKVEQMDKGSNGLQWCGEDILLIAAEGVPSEKFKDIEKRKVSSREAAVLYAQYSIMEKFVGACIGGACGGNYEGFGVTREYKEMILKFAKSGEVIDCVWDSSQNCSILFKVASPGLKKKVRDCSFDNI